MADDLVGAGAHALREPVVVERARVGVALDAELVHVAVDRVGGDAGLHHLAGEAQHLGGDDAGVAHALDDLGALDPRLGPALDDAGVGVGRALDVGRDLEAGADDALQHTAFERLVTALVLAAAAAPAGLVGLGEDVGGLRRLEHGSKAIRERFGSLGAEAGRGVRAGIAGAEQATGAHGADDVAGGEDVEMAAGSVRRHGGPDGCRGGGYRWVYWWVWWCPGARDRARCRAGCGASCRSSGTSLVGVLLGSLLGRWVGVTSDSGPVLASSTGAGRVVVVASDAPASAGAVVAVAASTGSTGSTGRWHRTDRAWSWRARPAWSTGAASVRPTAARRARPVRPGR